MAAPPHVYLDANVFIAAFENPGAHSDHAWWLISAVENGSITASTSELTLAEILVKPFELGNDELAAGYQQMITPVPGFGVLPVSRDILVEAAHLRARRTALRLPDAIHIATARSSACTFIVSDDRRLPAFDGLTVLPLSPFTLEDILRS